MPVNGGGRCAYDDLRDAGRLRVIKRKLGGRVYRSVSDAILRYGLCDGD